MVLPHHLIRQATHLNNLMQTRDLQQQLPMAHHMLQVQQSQVKEDQTSMLYYHPIRLRRNHFLVVHTNNSNH